MEIKLNGSSLSLVRLSGFILLISFPFPLPITLPIYSTSLLLMVCFLVRPSLSPSLPPSVPHFLHRLCLSQQVGGCQLILLQERQERGTHLSEIEIGLVR